MPESGPANPPSESQVRAHLARMLESPSFSGSARLCGFLRYIVEQTLEGKGDEIKEYSIAMEVYDRRSGYDPQFDSIVRVEASRLRKRLSEYYDGPGRETGLRIQLPRGAYRPRIVEVEATASALAPGGAAPAPAAAAPAPEPMSVRAPGPASALVTAHGGAPAPVTTPIQATTPATAATAPVNAPTTAPTSAPSHEAATRSASPALSTPARALPWKPALAVAFLVAGGLAFWNTTRQPGAEGGPESGPYAVLPMVNMTGQPGEDAFCDGLTEELTARLAAPGDLKVLARTTMSAFKGKAVDLAEAGAKLGVAYFLEGSVRRVAQRYRITLQLISARDGYHVWAQTYERPASDILAIEGTLAGEVVEQIRARTLGQSAWRSKGRTPATGAALAAFLEAGPLMRQDNRPTVSTTGIPPQLEQAVAKLQFAVEQKPDFTQAWVYLAHAYELCADYDPARTDEFVSKAKGASRQAIESDDTAAEGHASLATLELYRDLDPVRAEATFRRAVDLKPRDARLMRVYGDVLRILGEPEKAMAEIERAIAIAPDELRLRTQKALLLYSRGKWTQAAEALQLPLAANPRAEEAYWLKALILQGQGKYAEAEAQLREILKLRPRDTRALPALGNLLGVMGRRAEAASVARQMEQLVANGLVREYGLVLIYCGMGETAKALDWLERAYAHKDPSTVYLMVESRLAPLHNEPRARRIAEKMGLPRPSSN